MDDTRKMALTGIEMLERELVVRDFVTMLNDGEAHELLPFLTEDVTYKPSPHRVVAGAGPVVAMVNELRCTFVEWQVSLISVAVSGDVVLAEQVFTLQLPEHTATRAFGFASFRLDGYRICAWHQVYS